MVGKRPGHLSGAQGSPSSTSCRLSRHPGPLAASALSLVPSLPAPHTGYSPCFPGVLSEGQLQATPTILTGGRPYRIHALHYLQETAPIFPNHFQVHKRLCLAVSRGLSPQRRPSQRQPPCLLAGLALEAQGAAGGSLPLPRSVQAEDVLGFSICPPTPHSKGPSGGWGDQ